MTIYAIVGLDTPGNELVIFSIHESLTWANQLAETYRNNWSQRHDSTGYKHMQAIQVVPLEEGFDSYDPEEDEEF